MDLNDEKWQKEEVWVDMGDFKDRIAVELHVKHAHDDLDQSFLIPGYAFVVSHMTKK